MKISTARPRLATVDVRPVKPPPKTADPHYLTPEHKAWRDEVMERAGYRCEFVDYNGHRCRKAAPAHRLFANHKVERADGGADLDPNNGECLCGQHHSLVTARNRARRARPGG